jgi:hypothetical protein
MVMCLKGIDWAEENFDIFEKIILMTARIPRVLYFRYRDLLESGQIKIVGLDSDRLRGRPGMINSDRDSLLHSLYTASLLNPDILKEEMRKIDAHMAKKLWQYSLEESGRDVVFVARCGSRHFRGMKDNLNILFAYSGAITDQPAGSILDEDNIQIRYGNIRDKLGNHKRFRLWDRSKGLETWELIDDERTFRVTFQYPAGDYVSYFIGKKEDGLDVLECLDSYGQPSTNLSFLLSAGIIISTKPLPGILALK